MYIEKIQCFSIEDREADILVSDGIFKVLCYTSPVTNIEVGQYVESIVGFLCSDICLAEEKSVGITKNADHYSYCVTGILLSKSSPILRVGDLIIQLDSPIPGDVSEFEYVSCTIQRLDAVI